MFKLGMTKNEMIARNVCTKITDVLDSQKYGNEREVRNEIAVRSAKNIIQKIRTQMHDEKLVKAIETELENCHDKIDWKFT